jgi:hypothetical protein
MDVLYSINFISISFTGRMYIFIPFNEHTIYIHCNNVAEHTAYKYRLLDKHLHVQFVHPYVVQLDIPNMYTVYVLDIPSTYIVNGRTIYLHLSVTGHTEFAFCLLDIPYTYTVNCLLRLDVTCRAGAPQQCESQNMHFIWTPAVNLKQSPDVTSLYRLVGNRHSFLSTRHQIQLLKGPAWPTNCTYSRRIYVLTVCTKKLDTNLYILKFSDLRI